MKIKSVNISHVFAFVVDDIYTEPCSSAFNQSKINETQFQRESLIFSFIHSGLYVYVYVYVEFDVQIDVDLLLLCLLE